MLIAEPAIVTRVASGQIWLKRLNDSACGGCQQQAHCSTATLSKWLPKREFAVASDLSLQPGDIVQVEIDDSQILLSSLLLYLLPLAVMLLVVTSCDHFFPTTEAWLPEIAVSTLLLTFWLIHVFQTRLLRRFRLASSVSCRY